MGSQDPDTSEKVKEDRDSPYGNPVPSTAQAVTAVTLRVRRDEHTTKASSHFCQVGLDGEIIQCIPSTEISYTYQMTVMVTHCLIEVLPSDETGKIYSTNV